MDKIVLNLIPRNVFPDISSFINCITDDIAPPLFNKISAYTISKKIRKQEHNLNAQIDKQKTADALGNLNV